MQNQLRMDVIGKQIYLSKGKEEYKYDKVLSSLLFLYCVFMPFEEALASVFGSVLRLIAIAIMFYIFLISFNRKIYLRNITMAMPLCLWLVYAVFSVLWSSDFSWWMYFIKIYAFQIILVITVISHSELVDMDYMRFGLIVAGILASTLLICFPNSSGFTEEGRRTIIIGSTVFDPNIVASIIMLGVFCSLYYIFTLKKKHFIYKLISAYCFIGILFTGSRGALISIVGGMLVVLLTEMRQDRKSRRNAILLLLGTVIVLVLAYNLLPDNLIKSRFSKDTILGFNEYESGAHNRYSIWEHALILIKNNPIFGYGCGNFFSAITTVYSRMSASHNLYVLLLVEFGAIGCFIFLWGIFAILLKLIKCKQFVQFAMQLSVCIMALTLDSITYKYFWVCLMLSILVVNIRTGENEKL